MVIPFAELHADIWLAGSPQIHSPKERRTHISVETAHTLLCNSVRPHQHGVTGTTENTAGAFCVGTGSTFRKFKKGLCINITILHHECKTCQGEIGCKRCEQSLFLYVPFEILKNTVWGFLLPAMKFSVIYSRGTVGATLK